jgi:4,5-dihydroxyphthalate decarboxylase
VNTDLAVLNLFGGDYEHTLELAGSGPGYSIVYNARPPTQIFEEMLSRRTFEACEMSLSNYLIVRDRGADWLTAIPVFPNRAFRHGTVYVRAGSTLRSPKDLEGARFGVEDYTMTAAVWLRGTLHEEYQMDWRRIQWRCAERHKRFDPPPDVAVSYVRGDLEQLLLDGELDGIMSFGPRDDGNPPEQRRLRPLFESPQEVEREYYIRTRIYPINHCVVVRSDALARHPELPDRLLTAYAAAKKKAYARRLGGTLVPWGKLHWKSAFDLFGGDPLPYGLTPENRRVVDKLAEYAARQGLISTKRPLSELFLPVSTADD